MEQESEGVAPASGEPVFIMFYRCSRDEEMNMRSRRWRLTSDIELAGLACQRPHAGHPFAKAVGGGVTSRRQFDTHRRSKPHSFQVKIGLHYRYDSIPSTLLSLPLGAIEPLCH
jgi:hypothetical protein